MDRKGHVFPTVFRGNPHLAPMHSERHVKPEARKLTRACRPI